MSVLAHRLFETRMRFINSCSTVKRKQCALARMQCWKCQRQALQLKCVLAASWAVFFLGPAYLLLICIDAMPVLL